MIDEADRKATIWFKRYLLRNCPAVVLPWPHLWGERQGSQRRSAR